MTTSTARITIFLVFMAILEQTAAATYGTIIGEV
jgi:hypothetical protein